MEPKLFEGLPETFPYLKRLWRRNPSIQSPSNLILFLDRIEELYLVRPSHALELAETALDWSDSLSAFWPPQERLKACARACAVWGACHRVMGEIAKAEGAVLKASELLLRGGATHSADLLDIYARLAVIRIDQMELPEALQIADRLLEIAPEPNHGKALVFYAYVYYFHDPQAAWAAYNRAVPLVLGSAEKRLLQCSAALGYLVLSCELNKPVRFAAEIRTALSFCPPIAKPYFSWAMAANSADPGTAEALLDQAADAFEEFGNSVESATVKLDQALLYARIGRVSKAQEALAVATVRLIGAGLGDFTHRAVTTASAAATASSEAAIAAAARAIRRSLQRRPPHPNPLAYPMGKMIGPPREMLPSSSADIARPIGVVTGEMLMPNSASRSCDISSSFLTPGLNCAGKRSSRATIARPTG